MVSGGGCAKACAMLTPHLVSGYDMALIARPPVVGQSYAVVSQAVVALLRQAGLWQPGELEP